MTPDQLATVASQAIHGIPGSTIAHAMGVHPSTVSRNLRRDDIQQLIRDAQITLIQGSLSQAVRNQHTKIQASAIIAQKITDGKELSDGSLKLLELGHSAECKVLESVGIYPSHSQSITLNQILIDNRSDLSPAVEAMLARHLGAESNSGGDSEQSDQIIDVSPVDNMPHKRPTNDIKVLR
jgi:hypothetical protein